MSRLSAIIAVRPQSLRAKIEFETCCLTLFQTPSNLALSRSKFESPRVEIGGTSGVLACESRSAITDVVSRPTIASGFSDHFLQPRTRRALASAYGLVRS